LPRTGLDAKHPVGSKDFVGAIEEAMVHRKRFETEHLGSDAGGIAGFQDTEGIAYNFALLFAGRISATNEVTLRVLGWMGGRRRIGQQTEYGLLCWIKSSSSCDCDTPRQP